MNKRTDVARKTTNTTKRNTSKRKTSGNATRKKHGIYRFVRRIVLVAITATVILVAAISYMLLKIAVNPAHSGKDIDGSYTYMFSEYPFLKRWTDSLKINNALKDTTICTADGKHLHALYANAPRRTKNTAVIIHGYTDNAVRMLHIGYMYNHDLKYNILLPDLRNSGKSEGSHIQMGWKDRLDVLKWMDIANNIFGGNTKMVVHGISMGGATAMMVAGEKQPPYVKAYVEDCGYTSVWDEFKHEINYDYGLPDMPFLYIADLFCQWEYGWGFKEASAIEQIKKCDTPMLFIHGGADTYVPTEMVYKLYAAKPRNKEIWVVPGVMHARSFHDRQKEYTEIVRDFLSMYIY